MEPTKLSAGRQPRRRPLCVLLYSGGLDSTVLLWWLAQAHRPRYDVLALQVDYRQHNAGQEIHAAQETLAAYGKPPGSRHVCGTVRHELLSVPALAAAMSGSALTADQAVPRGPETAQTARATFVPNRNAVLLSLAYAKAQSIEAEAVAIATYEGLYPDGNRAFLRRFAQMEAEALSGMTHDGRPIQLLAPFAERGWDKTDVVLLGHELGVPFKHTRSCLDRTPAPCRHCASCVARSQAFAAAAAIRAHQANEAQERGA